MKSKWLVLAIVATGVAVICALPLLRPEADARSEERSMHDSDLRGLIRGYIRETRGSYRLQELALLVLASHARYNKETIALAARFFAKADYRTEAIMATAGLAADADHEIAHLGEIMELLIICGSETSAIETLAAKAAANELGKAELAAEIARYRAKAMYKSVDEAIAAQD